MNDMCERTAHQALPVVVVTGGSGFIGRQLVRRLARNYQVVNFDIEGDPESPAASEFVCVDVSSAPSVSRGFERVRSVYGTRIAAVVHLAAYYDFSGRPSDRYEAVNVAGTRNVVAEASTLCVEQFVFMSTMAVHRPNKPGHPIDERQPYLTTWPYPESKRLAEQLLDEQRPARQAVVMRLAGVYSEDCDSPLLASQIRRIDGRWLSGHLFPAELSRGNPFVHVDDVIEAVLRCLERRHALPTPFLPLLIGEPVTVGYGALQAAIGWELTGKRWRTFRIPKVIARAGARLRELNRLGAVPFVRPWMVDRAEDHYDLDIGSARQLLEWEPRRSIQEVLPSIVRGLCEDRARWYEHNGLEPPRRVRPRRAITPVPRWWGGDRPSPKA